jgi:hypothetical protein
VKQASAITILYPQRRTVLEQTEFFGTITALNRVKELDA